MKKGSIAKAKFRGTSPVAGAVATLASPGPPPKPSESSRAGSILIPLLALLIGLLGAGCQTTSSVHPQFAARTKGLTQLVVLPIPAISLLWQVDGLKEQEFPQVDEFRELLSQEIEKQFQARGFHVARSRLSPGKWSEITNGFENRENWMRLQYFRARQSLARVFGHDRSKAARPEASLLAEYDGGDALVFVQATVETESAGAKGVRWTTNTLGILVALAGISGKIASSSPEGCHLEVMLVEGRTGEVLWRSWEDWADPKSLTVRNLDAAVREVFARYPKP